MGTEGEHWSEWRRLLILGSLAGFQEGGTVGGVAKFQMLDCSQCSEKRGPQDSLNGSPWEVTSQSFSRKCMGFPWILKDESSQVISPAIPLNHIYILSLPATPIVQALATARIQRQAEGFQCWRGGWGEKVLMLCVLGRKRLTLGHMLQDSAAR